MSLPTQPESAAADDQELNLVEVWRTVRKHLWLAVATAVGVSLAVVFYTLGQTRIYQATATVQFDPNPPRPLGRDVDMVVDMGSGNYWDNKEYYETQYKIIQSMRVALAVVHDLDLNHDPSFLRNLPAGKAAGSPRPATPEEVAEVLRSRLTVDPVKDSRLANVRYDDADPARAQRILSTLLDTYVQQNLDDALASTASAAEWLRGQLDKLKGDLESNEMALHDYKKDKNILSLDLDAQSNMLREEMKQLNDALTSVRTKREEIAARRGELLKLHADDPTNLPASELLQSSLLQDLRQSYEAAVRERGSLLGEGKGDNHPDVMAANARVNATRAALLAEVRNIQGALDRDYAVISRQEQGLSGLFEKAKAQALDLNLLEIQYNRLKRSKDNTEKLYSLVLERTKESDLTRMMRVNNIRVIDRPLLPRVPVRPRVAINVAAGTMAGALLGVLAALGRAFMDRSLKTPEDVERELGLSCLGILPELESGKRTASYGRRSRRRDRAGGADERPELVVHAHPTSGIAEASRAIRTNLMFTAPDHPLKTLLVTSASPAEGKTTVACCIAIAMAQAGQRVAIVDCDLRRPRVHKVFRPRRDAGVTTMLLEGGGIDEEAFATEVPNLWAIPAGPVPPNPAELLHSERFKAFLGELCERFDRVVIDSPPAVAVTDPAILATIVDRVVMVVRAAATSKDLARHGLRALLDVGTKTVGVVLNAVDVNRREYAHYYYYGYKRGYYGPSAADGGGEPRAGAQA